MRIVIDLRPLEGSQYGGVAEYIMNLLPALFVLPTAHEFHLFFNARHPRRNYRGLFQHPNVTIHEFRYPNKLFTFSCRYLGRPFLDELVGGADVLFSPHFLPAPVSGNCRRVTTFHDIAFEYFPEFFDLKRRTWHRYISPRSQAEASHTLIAISHSTKDDLVTRYHVAPEKVSVVHSGLNKSILEVHDTGWNRIKRKYRIPDSYILSLSTVEPRKNVIGLIRAFNVLASQEHFSKTRLVIAGQNGWAYQSILREARQSPHRARIIFTGPIQEEDKGHIYRHASLFVYPSRYEGFGFPPLEAMYCGVPTLVSAISSLPEVVGEGALLIDPHRPSEMAAVMREVLFDERLRNHLIDRGRRRADGFDWHITAQETLRVLERAV